jgi:hypothetical protein
MPLIRERDIERPFVAWAKKIGIKVKKKLPGEQLDRWLMLPGGRVMIIEFKAPGKKPTPLQAQEIKELQELGYHVEIHDNLEEAKQAVVNHLASWGCSVMVEAERANPTAYPLGASRLSAQRDSLLARAQRSGVIPRPRPRENVDNAGSVQSPQKGKARKKDAARRPA